MTTDITQIISCPYHKDAVLSLKVSKSLADEIVEGFLKCNDCGRVFPIKNGIPYLLVDDLMSKIQSPENIGGWAPGPGKWKPDFISKFISIFGKIEKNAAASQFCLNIGCGENSEEGINIDVYIPKNIPKNFILASAENLPFKDNAFDIVKSSYVVEHLLNPVDFIKRQVDIAREKVIIVTDNSEWLGDMWFRLVNNGRIFHSEHYYRWTKEYLQNLLNRIGLRATVYRCELSPSYLVKAISKLGKIPRIGAWFYRDIIAEVYKK